jgi:uncharacterized protein (DUF924 family)
MNYQHIIDFWFLETKPAQWWRRSDEFDRLIRERFGAVLVQAAQCELYAWRLAPLGRLAEIIVLDQFSRTIHRATAQAFASDSLALALAQEAIAAHVDEALEPAQKAFLYMPFMHSESPEIHAIAVTLFDQDGLDSYLQFELRHKAIIDRFGRYPHRNALLGRASSEEEIEFLKTPGSSF